MATSDKVLKRAYSISLPGATKAIEQVKQLEAAFESLRKKKLELNGTLGTAIAGKDASAVEELRKQIAGLEEQMKKLTKQRNDAGKEALNQARAEQALANAEAARARATAEQARAERERTTTAIAQEKELDRLIAQEEKQNAALERQRQKAQAASGSYNALYQEYRELYNLLKATPEGTSVDFRGQTLGFDEAIDKLKELAAAEQDFRRQFSRDGLLVGEYTSGIIKAFKDAGLGDLIAGQITKGQQELDKLNQEFEQTRQQLAAIGAAGQGNFEVLERALIENRTQAAELERQLGTMQNEFRGVGDVGNQVSSSLSRGFQQLGSDIRQFVLGYVGFQALLSTTQAVFGDTIKLDSQASALTVVSKSTDELARNQQFLSETTDRLGLRILDTTQSFKNFFAASTEAGIAAEETRNIYEAAAATGANLKLSQEDINGVLTAFGQIASKGKVQAEELRGQIGERVPGAFAIAARAIGVTQQELNKMLEQGEVIAQDFLPKFARELQATFGGDSTARVEGLQASINRLRNQFTLMIAENREGLTTVLSGFIKAGGVLLSIIGLLTGNLPLVTVLLGTWAIGWAVLNKETVIANARLLLLNAQIVAGRIALGAVTLYTTAHSAAMGIFTGVTTVATGAVRIFNTVILANPLGIFLAVLGLVVAAFSAFAGAATGSTEALQANARQMELNADLQKAIADATASAISKIQELTKVVLNNKAALEDRKKALADLIALNPEYLGTLTLENIKTREGVGLLLQYVNALKAKAEVEAISAGREKAVRRQIEAQQGRERASTDEDFAKRTYADLEKQNSRFFSTPSVSALVDAVRFGTLHSEQALVKQYFDDMYKEATQDVDFYDKKATDQITKSAERLKNSQNHAHAETIGEKRKRLDESIKENKANAEKLAASDEAGLKKNLADRKALQKQLDELDGKDKEKTYGGSKLTGGQKDAQRDAEAAKDAAIRAENVRFEELKKLRALEVADEVEHLQKLAQIESAGLDKKLASLSGKNAAERKLAEELRDKKAEIATQTAQKIYEVQEEFAKRALDKVKSDAEAQLTAVRNSGADPLTLAEAQVAYLQKIEAATRAYYATLETAAVGNKDRLAQIEQQKSDALRGIASDLYRDLRQMSQARFDYELSQLERVRALQEQILRTQTAGRRMGILNSGLTPEKKQRALNQLEDENEVAGLDSQINLNNREIEAYKRKYGVLAALNKDYTELVARNTELMAQRQQKAQQNEFNYATGVWKAKEESLTSYLAKKLNLDSKEIAAIQQGMQIGQQIGQQMLQNYFQQENDRVEQKKNATLERLDLEKTELLGNAQSAGERAAIEKQYAQKKKQAEKDAAKERQQLALQQLEVESAIGIAKTLASTPYPANLILAGLESLLFLQQRKKILSQKFRYGGMPEGGGDIGGQPHSQGGTPFEYGGTPYEAEAEEIAIVNRRSALMSQRMTVTGTPRQIASAINEAGGGVRFAPGAAVRRYEYGGMLQAPAFTPGRYYSNNAPAGGNDLQPILDALTAQGAAIAATAGRIDTLQVHQVTTSVTEAQSKEVKNKSVAVL